MIENPIRRYSVGDRTTGLRIAADGSVTILLSRDNPDDPTANWLPVEGARFYLMMRLYRPRDAVLTGSWLPPAIERVGDCF